MSQVFGYSIFSPNAIARALGQTNFAFTRQSGGQPVYDIDAVDQDTVDIHLLVPGFSRDELKISLLRDELTVEGVSSASEKSESSNIPSRVFRALVHRSFRGSFLVEGYIVRGVSLSHGILTIRLRRNDADVAPEVFDIGESLDDVANGPTPNVVPDAPQADGTNGSGWEVPSQPDSQPFSSTPPTA